MTYPSAYQRHLCVILCFIACALPTATLALVPPANVECCQRKEYESPRCTQFALSAAQCEKVYAEWVETYRRINAVQKPALPSTIDTGLVADMDRVMAEAGQSGFSGVVIIGDATRVLFEKSIGFADERARLPHSAAMRWRWASISKQVTAVIAAQLVAEGKLSLDATVGDYLTTAQFPARYAKQITLRHLLQHTSGLPNPSDTETPSTAFPAFYRAKVTADKVHREATRNACAAVPKRAPGEYFEYNNCDYLVLAALIEQVTGQRFADVLAARITAPLKLTSVELAEQASSDKEQVKGYTSATQPEAEFNLATYGAAGAITGSPQDLLALDRALMGDTLLSAAMKKQFWNGNPKFGYAALGVWSFPAALKGCKGAVDLIERRGAIGGVQARNIIAPTLSKAIVIFTNRADWEFGEIWQGKGFAHELLSAALCQ